ncbi:MAG: response regulator [Rubrivivax sp.]
MLNALAISPADRRDLMVVTGAAGLQALILVADVLTPLGYAFWVLHLFPLSFALLQRQRWAPALLAGLALLFTAIGFFLSDINLSPEIAIANRLAGSLSFIIVGAVITQVLAVRAAAQTQMWLQQTVTLLSERLVDDMDPDEVGRRATAVLCEALAAEVGVLYRLDQGMLRLCGGHAIDGSQVLASLPQGEGLLGQAVVDGRLRVVSPAPAGHVPLRTALGVSAPAHLLVLPLRAEGRPVGVIEIGLVRRELDLPVLTELAARCREVIGVALRSAGYRQEMQALLQETQRQAEELQSQQEELRVSNEELEEQSRVLRESQSELESQQSELERVNAQLAVHAQTLEQQKRTLQRSQAELQDNAEALAAASQYKSEFLANMSHELRTPLNSSLILSRLLVDNKPGTLTADQVRYAHAIHDANNDLLALINDILDLSKIEAGHADLRGETVVLGDLLTRLRTLIEPQTRHKGLEFSIDVDPDAPAQVVTDGQRLSQVLRNLLSNAIKFTAEGRIDLRLGGLANGGLRFEVRDTGLGIPADKQQVIFDAFRQADGSTSRQFGGTGLGLSISRELVQRMGGRIAVESAPGRGSTFSVELPAELPEQAPPPEPGSTRPAPLPEARAPRPQAPVSAPPPAVALPATPPSPAAPPAARLPGQRRVVLAVEDDNTFAEVLRELITEADFECVIASTGEQALTLVRELRPSGVLLDVGLPDLSGLSVLERLKRDPATRHIPVHVVSATDRSLPALELGAVGHVVKPALREQLVQAIQRLKDRFDRPLRRVLVVEDDAALRHNLEMLLGTPDVQIVSVGTVADALAALAESSFDCMVTDLQLPDGSGFDLLERMAQGDRGSFPPVIVYTGRALSRDEETQLRRHSRSIIVKGARSPERLLDEVTLFLHSVESSLPSEQQRMLRAARQRDAVLEGRRILLAEDDVRNIFALTSVFEPLGTQLEIARNGREAVERLQRPPAIDLVLMDIMMPEMDGLTAMRHIRVDHDAGELPIIALTAKAMADDRQQCLDAGANDYLAKPIDVDRLVSLCRVWIRK